MSGENEGNCAYLFGCNAQHMRVIALLHGWKFRAAIFILI